MQHRMPNLCPQRHSRPGIRSLPPKAASCSCIRCSSPPYGASSRIGSAAPHTYTRLPHSRGRKLGYCDGSMLHHTDRPLRRESISEPSRKSVLVSHSTGRSVSGQSVWPATCFWSPFCASLECIWPTLGGIYYPFVTVRDTA